ncbi:MAG: response regulator [Deltaproteobacteria bacterium]|nr:response regulator [Deltaproteobacteria bacterium]
MTVVVIHFISLAALLFLGLISWSRLRAWLARDVLILLTALLGITMLNDVNNILERLSSDIRPHFTEEIIEVLIPLMWLSLFYGWVQHLARKDLRDEVEQRKKAEQEQRRLETSMFHAQKLESLGVLTGGIAHDFNNILTTIMGNADLLQMQGEEPLKEAQQISLAAQRAADLCSQMLAYSGKAQIDPKPVDVNALLLELQSLLRASLSKKAILEYSLADDLPKIQADPSQLRQVFMNLIINASESMNENAGRIIISSAKEGTKAKSKPTTTAWFETEPLKGQGIRIEINDSGCGMDQETIQRIFDPFFTTKFTGRGLGLAAVQGIIRSHDGQLIAASDPGQGSSFVVLLPIPKGLEADPPETDEQDPASWHGWGKILVVEDERPLRKLLAQMLTTLEFEVVEAENGQQALELIEPDIRCIVLDWAMPVLGGADVLKTLHEQGNKIPVLISSGFDVSNLADPPCDRDSAPCSRSESPHHQGLKVTPKLQVKAISL